MVYCADCLAIVLHIRADLMGLACTGIFASLPTLFGSLVCTPGCCRHGTRQRHRLQHDVHPARLWCALPRADSVCHAQDPTCSSTASPFRSPSSSSSLYPCLSQPPPSAAPVSSAPPPAMLLASSSHSDTLSISCGGFWFQVEWKHNTIGVSRNSRHFVVSLCGCVDALCFRVLPFEFKVTGKAITFDEDTGEDTALLTQCGDEVQKGDIWSRKGVV